MGLFEKTWKLEQRHIVVIFFILFLIASLLLVFNLENENWKNIAISISAGLIIALIQFGLSWYEYVSIDKYRRMGIKNIYDDKYKEEMYGEKIKGAKQKIYLMGNTARKFLEDFANLSSRSPAKQVLIKQLEKGVEVRILVAAKQIFIGQEKRLRDYADAEEIIKNLRDQYTNFECKYYLHEPAHSIFVFDNECFIGPIFPGISSFDIPFIHMYNEKDFASSYIEYFNNEWNKANSNDH
jgi:hypothetical protein